MSKVKYYNEDIKLKFVAEADVPPSYKQYAKQLFAASYSKENELQQEIREWPRKDVIDFLLTNASYTYGTYKTHIYSLNAYLTWSNKDYRPIDLQEVDFSEIQKNNLFGSPSDLQDWMERAFDSVRLNTVSVFYRSCVWLTYMGIPENAFARIDNSDVDLTRKIISLDGIIYPIPKEALPAIKRCKSLDEFIEYGSNKYKTKRMEGTAFLRPTIKGKGFDSAIKRWSENTSVNSKLPFAAQTIRRSGTFYRLYQLEQQKIVPNFLQAYLEFSDSISEKILHKKKSTYIAYTKIEYEAWKQAFYPETKT